MATHLHGSQFSVYIVMLGARAHLQIIYPVVILDFVLMMNNESVRKKAPERELHHQDVLWHVAYGVAFWMRPHLNQRVSTPYRLATFPVRRFLQRASAAFLAIFPRNKVPFPARPPFLPIVAKYFLIELLILFFIHG